jgi:biopolymer transport protein TolR
MAFSGPDSGAEGIGIHSVLAEINVTPLVDVMLVLLIIFMVTAPMLTQGLEIDLPQAVAGNLQDPEDVLILEIDADQNLQILEREMSILDLGEKLPAIMENRVDKRLFVRADEVVPYGFVVQVLASAKEAGVIDVGLVTEPVEPDGDESP